MAVVLRSPRRAIAAVVVVAMAVLFAAVLLGGGGDDDQAAPVSPTADANTDANTGDSDASRADNGDDPCTNAHAEHNMMMWNAVMADEMLVAGCGWPYDPFLVSLDGGEVDDTITAEFVPRMYDEIWRMLGGLGVGVCQISSLPDEPGDGFTFGFTYAVSEPGCPTDAPGAMVVVREYATRAFRDQHANGAGPGAMVLGRWVIEVDGDAPAVADQVAAAFTSIGAVEVS